MVIREVLGRVPISGNNQEKLPQPCLIILPKLCRTGEVIVIRVKTLMKFAIADYIDDILSTKVLKLVLN